MAKFTFTGVSNPTPIFAKSWDYENAMLVGFCFLDVRTGFGIPNDITIDEMADILELTARSLRNRESKTHILGRYAKIRAEHAKQMREEEEQEQLQGQGNHKGTNGKS